MLGEGSCSRVMVLPEDHKQQRRAKPKPTTDNCFKNVSRGLWERAGVGTNIRAAADTGSVHRGRSPGRHCTRGPDRCSAESHVNLLFARRVLNILCPDSLRFLFYHTWNGTGASSPDPKEDQML
ncbi:hypothetical protein CB1_000273035 [Camelus ferus]|nr:hypothetical protein CB1_000273035 [Camelus ferus]